jgi:hypothetical protein
MPHRSLLYWPPHDSPPRAIAGGPTVNAEFNWWLLIVGLVVGAALTWLVMADSSRREADITEAERPSEAVWIAAIMSAAGHPTEPRRIEDVLRLHSEYVAGPPPDDPLPADSAGRHGPDAERHSAKPQATMPDVDETRAAHQRDERSRVADVRD